MKSSKDVIKSEQYLRGVLWGQEGVDPSSGDSACWDVTPVISAEYTPPTTSPQTRSSKIAGVVPWSPIGYQDIAYQEIRGKYVYLPLSDHLVTCSTLNAELNWTEMQFAPLAVLHTMDWQDWVVSDKGA